MVDLFLLPWAFFDRWFLLFSSLACFFLVLLYSSLFLSFLIPPCKLTLWFLY